MGIIFEGQKFAATIEEEIKKKLKGMPRKPRLVTFYDPNDIGSRIYTHIKARKAEELGIEFRAITPTTPSISLRTSSLGASRQLINDLNKDENVDGIMIQVPFPNSEELISLIDLGKDVDGLRGDSPYLPATVRAILAILEKSLESQGPDFSYQKIAVIGDQGEVGKRLIGQLAAKKHQFSVIGMGRRNFDSGKIKQAEIIISCTGEPGLITPEMVMDQAICIDVGYPKGDFDSGCAQKALFSTPVPGGVGPVTVVMLFANLVKL